MIKIQTTTITTNKLPSNSIVPLDPKLQCTAAAMGLSLAWQAHQALAGRRYPHPSSNTPSPSNTAALQTGPSARLIKSFY